MFAEVLGSCPLPALFQHRMLTTAKDLECAVHKQKVHVNKQKIQYNGFHKASTKKNKQTKNKNRTNSKLQKGKN